MSKYQKEDIQNSIKNDSSQNILKKIIKNERLSKMSNTKKMNFPDKNKKPILNNNNTNNTYYSSVKRHYPNLSINSSNILNSIKSNNKTIYSINTVDRFSTSSLNRINNKLIALKNYGSTKDLHSKIKNNTIAHNHNKNFLLISSLPETPSLNSNSNYKTENNNKNYNNIGIKEINTTKKSTTILYKRRNDTDTNNLAAIYNTLNNLNKNVKDNNIKNYNSINNYKMNSITYRINQKNEFKTKNITDNLKYKNDSQTYNSKDNIFTYEPPKKGESRFRADELFTFNPKEDISYDNSSRSLLYRRLKRNPTMDRKYKILSVHNSSIGRNFFFNPFQNSLGKDIYSYSKHLNLNNSKDKIDINNYLKHIKNNNSFHGIRNIHNLNKNNIDSIMKYKDRRDNKLINLDRFDNKTDRGKIDSIKKNIFKNEIKSINNINTNQLKYLNNTKYGTKIGTNNIIKNDLINKNIENILNKNKKV